MKFFDALVDGLSSFITTTTLFAGSFLCVMVYTGHMKWSWVTDSVLMISFK